MNARRTTLGLAMLAALLLLTPFLAAGYKMPPDLTTYMKLYPRKGGPLLYTGVRHAVERDGRVRIATSFATPDGQTVQETETEFEADSLDLISYRRHDPLTGELDIMKREGDKIVFHYRASTDAKTETASIAFKPGLLYSQTVAHYTFRHFQELQDGKTLGFELIVGSRQDTYGFRLVPEPDAAQSGAQKLVVRMEPSSWFVRQLVDPMYFVWEVASPPRLLEYRGRSSIKTADGKAQDLRYDYSYKAD